MITHGLLNGLNRSTNNCAAQIYNIRSIIGLQDININIQRIRWRTTYGLYGFRWNNFSSRNINRLKFALYWPSITSMLWDYKFAFDWNDWSTAITQHMLFNFKLRVRHFSWKLRERGENSNELKVTSNLSNQNLCFKIQQRQSSVLKLLYNYSFLIIQPEGKKASIPL